MASATLADIARENDFRNLLDGDEWMLGEDIPSCDFFFAQVWLQSFVNDMEHSVGVNYSKILGVFSGENMRFYYGKGSCHEFAKAVLKKITDNPSFGKTINRNIITYSDGLESTLAHLPPDFAKASDEELWHVIREHVEAHTQLYEWGWLSNATDMFYPEFTEHLKSYLRGKANSESQVNEWFIALTSPSEKSEEAKQHDELLGLAIEIENSGEDALFKELGGKAALGKLGQASREKIFSYAKKYASISALWLGSPFPAEHYAEELESIFRSAESPTQQLEAAAAELIERREAKAKLVAELAVDGHYQLLFEVFGEFMLTKFYRRYAQLRVLYAMRPVFDEISRRFSLSGLQARFMISQEYGQLLSQHAFGVKQLAEREKHCVLYAEKSRAHVFVGEEARVLEASAEQKIDKNVTELKGQCACLGKATGHAKILHSAADMHKMQQGDILIAIATNPDVVPAMKKAAAIVTEQGGVTSHAAIVSREFGIPCVIGTKIATKVFKDGDLLEVDASNGVVRKVG